jgi:glycosyltransferase involved in cell wall biosynthesis
MPDQRPSNGLHLGIAATNIRQGGGVTHLSRLLDAADPQATGIDRITVWAPLSTCRALPRRADIECRSAAWMQAGLARRAWGQRFQVPREIRAAGCDVAFYPGGVIPGRSGMSTVTMSQNMLPFEPEEAARFGRASPMRLKMRLLRSVQGRSFRQADGVVFLTRHAQSTITGMLGPLPGRQALIAHGIEARFLQTPRPARELAQCSVDQPFRLLYVSILMPYKHQKEVAVAVHRLRRQGLPVEMRFAGADWGRYGAEFRQLLDELDPGRSFLRWDGEAPFATLHELYRDADAFVFASSCENLPNILVEAMAAGLAVASSAKGPMPEVLADAGVYFDPLSSDSIADVLRELIGDRPRREALAHAARRRAADFSWQRCASETLSFIAQVATRAGGDLPTVHASLPNSPSAN